MKKRVHHTHCPFPHFVCRVGKEARREWSNWFHRNRPPFYALFFLQVLALAVSVSFVVLFSHTAYLEVGVSATVPITSENDPATLLNRQTKDIPQTKPIQAYNRYLDFFSPEPFEASEKGNDITATWHSELITRVGFALFTGGIILLLAIAGALMKKTAELLAHLWERRTHSS